MAYYLDFFAFNEAPDISKLKQIKWLTGWRLFQQAGTAAWYLVGPDTNNEIGFHEPLEIGAPPVADYMEAFAERIIQRIEPEGGHKSLFDKQMFLACWALSAELGQPVIHAGGDDEGADSFFTFDSGTLIAAKFEMGWDRALIVQQDGAILVDQFHPSGTDPDLAKPRIQHEIANQGMATFFGAKSWQVSSDPDDCESSEYHFLDKQGEAPAKYVAPSEILFQRLGHEPSFAELLKEVGRDVDAALAEDLITAENERRFEADKVTLHIAVYISRCYDQPKWLHRHLVGSMKSFFSELSGYTRELRPKPDFRRNGAELPVIRRRLSRQWQAIKLESRILG